MDYDGVIPPYDYLVRWRRLDDVRFVAGAGWAPAGARRSRAPSPSAFLISSSDISSARAVEARSLRSAIAKPLSIEGAPGGAEAAPPATVPPAPGG